ncbi:hypothetical protein IEQ34_010731 [Dendrobium chrysotoxum]|uniref:Uncharacterized protein n=1 Tax=Dendrobium chrysotoxum TaxID=161865 RepID=A0AAV7GWM3_DENCH|nr:hypothetical protein IEQ34_010731 [Dendrobium chrysotoxum]
MARLLRLPIHGGIGPLRRPLGIKPERPLLSRMRFSRQRALISSAGISPSRRFCHIIRSRSCERDPREEGILPRSIGIDLDKLFELRSSSSSAASFESPTGRTPVRLFIEDRISIGKSPEKLLLDKMSVVKDENVENSPGRTPEKLLLERFRKLRLRQSLKVPSWMLPEK